MGFHSLFRDVQNISPESEEGEALTREVEAALYPKVTLTWAERNLQAHRTPQGKHLIESAVATRDHDNRPALLLSQAARLCVENGFFEEAHEIYNLGLLEYPNDLFFPTQKAKLFLKQDKPQEAINLLKALHESGQGDKVIATALGKAYLQLGQSYKVMALLEPLNTQERSDSVLATTLANAYIHAGLPDKAIDVLEPFGIRQTEDAFLAGTLSNAYLHSGQPDQAVALLKKLHANGLGNEITYATLADACTSTQDRNLFYDTKDKMAPGIMRDYLEAKFLYLEGSSNKAKEIVSPYVQGDILNAPPNILSLYLACTPDESPIMGMLHATVGDEKYEEMMTRRDTWRAHPARADLGRTDISRVSHHFYEVGPVSGNNRIRAPLGISLTI